MHHTDTKQQGVGDPSIRKTLLKIVLTVERNPSLQEELLQEAYIHYWSTQEQRPGQSLSWYLQSCRYHLLNYLSRGCSVDSLKRRHTRSTFGGCGSDNGESYDIAGEEDSVVGPVSAQDLIEVLSKRAKPMERATLDYLVDGFGVREIALKLQISHQAVSKHRKGIAAMAAELGVCLLGRPRQVEISTCRDSDVF